MTNIIPTLRRGLAALLMAAVTATTALPGLALAQSRELPFDGTPRFQTTQAETAGPIAKDSAESWKCGYVTKREGKYLPRHVNIVKFKKRVDCYEEFKKKKPVVVRGFKGDTSDKYIRQNIADSANR